MRGEPHRLLLIGSDPVIALAASLYEAAFQAAGLDVGCEVHGARESELVDLLAGIRGDRRVVGAAVLMPDAVRVVALLDALDPAAKTIKAVNTISQRSGGLLGWNTDRDAFGLALGEAEIAVKGRTVLMLGAGAAARASVAAIRTTAGKVWVTSPDLDQARRLCRDLEVTSGGPTPIGSLSLVTRKVDVIVNATPVGSDGESVLFPLEWVSPSQIVFDLLCQPPVTPLLRGARERGARAVNGLSMLLFNGLAAFQIWTGQPASEAAMRAALERAVLNQLGT